jgi:hypothetical protein
VARRTDQLRSLPDLLAPQEDEADDTIAVIPTDEAALFWSKRRHPAGRHGEAP